MFLELDSERGRAMYAQIIDEVRRQVALHILRADDPLPPVRELAVELKVNPNTVQHAYRELVRVLALIRAVDQHRNSRAADTGARDTAQERVLQGPPRMSL